MFELQLYVTGQYGKSAIVVDGIKAMLAGLLDMEYSLRVVDVLENPESAIDNQVFATPTLLRCAPPPTRKVMGDLSDQSRVLTALELTHKFVG